MQLPLVKTKNEGYYEYGNMSVTIGDKKITSTDDFLAIGNSAASLKKKYVLDSNLDFPVYPIPVIWSAALLREVWTETGIPLPAWTLYCLKR